MLTRIDDPKILNQLKSSPQLQKITDPNVLSQLSQQKSQPQPQPQPQPKDNFSYPNMPFVGHVPTPQETQQAKQNANEALLGASQNFLNTPEEAANVFGKHLYNKFNYAPHTKAAEIGGNIGDIASFELPGGLANIGLKGLGFIPKVGEAINFAREGLQSKPITNFFAKLLKAGGEGALYQGEKNPQSTGIDIAKAGGLGSTVNALTQAISSSNPFIRTLSKLGLGSTLGYSAGGLPGIPEGIAAAFIGPKMLGEAGYNREPLAHEILTRPQNALARQKYLAGQSIGDVPTPAEAFNHPPMATRQGMIGRTEEGAEAMSNEGQARLGRQKNAINDLLNSIFPNTDIAKNNVKNLYNQAYQHNLTINAMDHLGQNNVFNQAVRKVESEPVYQQSLKSVGASNFAYLDQVKRALNDLETESLGPNGKATNKSRVYRQTANELTDIMDKEAPVYKQARTASQANIIRDQIETRLQKKPISGNNFYKEFLGNDLKFNSLIKDLKNNPQAQETLKNMKLAWSDLIGYDTVKSAAGMAQRHTSSAREGFQKFWNEYKDLLGAPRDIQRAQFIHDPKWWDKFDDVMKYKDKLQRNEKLGQLISKGLTAGTLEYAKETTPKKKKD